jgi:hypothetical protein
MVINLRLRIHGLPRRVNPRYASVKLVKGIGFSFHALLGDEFLKLIPIIRSMERGREQMLGALAFAV